MKMKGGVPKDLRRVHRSMVLQGIFTSKGSTRTQLATQTGLSTMAITRIIRELIEVGIIEEMGKRDREGNPGRKQTKLRIRPIGAYVVGVVLSAFGHEIAIMDATGKSIIKDDLVLVSADDPISSLQSVAEKICSLIDKADIEKDRVLGIGVAISAFVQSTNATVLKAPYLGWEEVELGQEISLRTGLPLIAENIADAINLGEQSINALDGAGGVFLVHTSVACGASYTHHGDLIRGVNFSAGQIGHLPVSKSSLTCSCGASDCLNTHASGWAVLANLGRTGSKIYSPKNNDTYANALNELIATDPDQSTKEGFVLYEAGKKLAATLKNISLIVDPETIVLAGKLPQSSSYVAGCRDAWDELAPANLRQAPQLITGHITPLEAAGLLGLNTYLFSPELDIEALVEMGKMTENKGVI